VNCTPSAFSLLVGDCAKKFAGVYRRTSGSANNLDCQSTLDAERNLFDSILPKSARVALKQRMLARCGFVSNCSPGVTFESKYLSSNFERMKNASMLQSFGFSTKGAGHAHSKSVV
jgi:hypothetical protein